MNDITVDASKYLGETESGFREQVKACRLSTVQRMAVSLAHDVKTDIWSRKVAVAALKEFCSSFFPTGKGQAEKSEAMANGMIDDALKAMGTEEEAAKEGEQPEAQAPEGEQAQGPKPKSKAA